VNATDNWQWTPLHESCAKEKFDVALLLVRHGANVDKKNLDGLTPLDLCRNDSDLKALLTGEYRKSEFLEAARRGDESLVEQLLTPLNVNSHASDGRRSTALHLSSGYNRIQIVKRLLDKGANVHSRDKGELIPLHNACSYGHYAVVRLLLEHGTDPNSTDMWSFTPLHEAILKNRWPVCSLLLAYKADPYARNCYDKTAFDLAAELEDEHEVLDNLIYEYYGYCLHNAVRASDFFKVKRILNTNLDKIKAEFDKKKKSQASNDDEEAKSSKNKHLINFKECLKSNTPLHSAVVSAGKSRDIIEYI
jgi:tankyrase